VQSLWLFQEEKGRWCAESAQDDRALAATFPVSIASIAIRVYASNSHLTRVLQRAGNARMTVDDPFRTVTSGGFPASQHASGYKARTFKLLI